MDVYLAWIATESRHTVNLNSGRVHLQIAPLNNQIAPLWGVDLALGNAALES